MTYQEIKERLTQCEVKLEQLHSSKSAVKSSKNYNVAVEKLTVLKESLEKRLSEAEKTAFVNGQATEYTDEKELQKFKDNQDVKSIKTAGGKTIKEAMKFSKDETKSIAREVGKALAKALKSMGDEIAHMKAHKIEDSSFEINVEYKDNTVVDDFSFYISDDKLHLTDFTFDKELTDVGVKPSGEAIVHVDVLANELIKHFKSQMKEGMSDQEFADAEEAGRLEKHPEKSTIEKIQALIAAQKNNEDASPEEEEKFHKKLDTLVHKTFGKRKEELEEAPIGKSYIKVAVRDARKALEILNDVPAYVKDMELDGSDTYYFNDHQLAYDAMMDLMAQGVEVTDQNVEEGWDMDEASDYAKRRAAERDYQPAKKDKPAKPFKEPKNDYFARRKAEMQEGDVDAEMDGGDLDVGHQDDEPNMLRKDLYDIITYAAKLYKQLAKYDNYDGEVDFPQWWQKKIILSRDYMSAAQHYLESEEKQPAIDQLALEGKTNEDHSGNPNDKYVVRPCKHPVEKWAVWEGEKRVKGFKTKPEAQAFADKKNKEQGLNEEKATCCGKCGRVHVKGTECKRPFLKGKDHCRYN